MRVYVYLVVFLLVLFFVILIFVILVFVVVIFDCKNGDCLVIDKFIELFEILGYISFEWNDMVEVVGSYFYM